MKIVSNLIYQSTHEYKSVHRTAPFNVVKIAQTHPQKSKKISIIKLDKSLADVLPSSRPSSLRMLIAPSPHHCSPIGRAPLHSSVKTGASTGGGNCSPGSSRLLAFSRLKKPMCQEMSARSYALHSVCPQLSFFSFQFSYACGSQIMGTDPRIGREES